MVLSPIPLGICKNMVIIEPITEINITYEVYSYSRNLNIGKTNAINIQLSINIVNTEVLIFFFILSELSLESIRNLNIPCSNCKVKIIINNVVYVLTKSTLPYSSVDKIEVYKGSKKKT